MCRMEMANFNESISVSAELHRTLYAIFAYSIIVCAATLTVTGIQWLNSSLLCSDTQQLNQRIREEKLGNEFKARIFVCSGSDLPASLCKLCPVEKVLQKCGVVGLTCTSLFFRVNNSVPN